MQALNHSYALTAVRPSTMNTYTRLRHLLLRVVYNYRLATGYSISAWLVSPPLTDRLGEKRVLFDSKLPRSLTSHVFVRFSVPSVAMAESARGILHACITFSALSHHEIWPDLASPFTKVPHCPISPSTSAGPCHISCSPFPLCSIVFCRFYLAVEMLLRS